MYTKTFTVNDFILNDEGVYVATILATTHGLGTVVHLGKALRHIGNNVFDNVLPSYRTLVNGDFEFYVSEPGAYRIRIEEG